MKKVICLTIVLCLVLGSFSFSFAVDWSTSDQSNLSNAASRLLTISNTLSNIYTRLGTIQGYLFDDNHSLAYWASAISSWMSPMYARLGDILQQNIDLTYITGMLGSVDTSGSTIIRTPYLFYNGKSNANWLSDLYTLDSVSGSVSSTIGIWYYSGLGQLSFLNWTPPNNWRQTLISLIQTFDNNQAIFMSDMYNGGISNYNSQQSLVSFADPDSTVTFTPLSATDGLYKYLNAINTPLARLGYVLASDSRIEAQQAAAANEQEVVDSFIDSNGSGAASTSDFSDMAGLSSGYSSNFNTGQSASGLFTVFGSDKWTYLSQDTMDSFDTTGNGNSRSKSNTEYDTPYLDRYYEEVLSLMGLEDD